MQNCQEMFPTNELSDEALLSAVSGGDAEALESLYTRYHRLLYSLTYRMVADHQIAEDLLQDAFIAVWRRSDTYSPQAGAARGWLISILHHRTIDHLRKLRRRHCFQEGPLDEAELDEKVGVTDVWEAAWHNVRSDQVRAALLTIPPEQRQVIELAYFQGRTHMEIAVSTQVPLGTVKARIRLGLRHLKYALEQMGLDETCMET